ncbi:hypothetical protein MMC14_001624 [Varicellaria rhodocarpa]|nr:hypothetical protein [Varicellaria rhodocarpa]
MSSSSKATSVRNAGFTTLYEPEKPAEATVEKRKRADTISEAARPTKRSAVFWPSHLLSEDCPYARILTWGYDSNVSAFFHGAASKNDIFSNARNLLGDLDGERRHCVGQCPVSAHLA